MDKVTDAELDACIYSLEFVEKDYGSFVLILAKELQQLRAENARLREALVKMKSNLQDRADELEDDMLGDDNFMNNYSEMSGERIGYLEAISQLNEILTPSTQSENVSKNSERKCLNCGKILSCDNETAVCDEDCFYANIYKKVSKNSGEIDR